MRESDFINGLSALEIGASIKASSRVKRTIRDLLESVCAVSKMVPTMNACGHHKHGEE